MLNIAVFGATVSYVLMMLAHIVLRRHEPDLDRGYRTPRGIATSGVALALATLYFLLCSRHHLVSSAPEEEFEAISSAESELRGA